MSARRFTLAMEKGSRVDRLLTVATTAPVTGHRLLQLHYESPLTLQHITELLVLRLYLVSAPLKSAWLPLA